MVALLIAKYRFFPPQFCTLKTSQIFALPTSRGTFQVKGSSLIKLKIVRGNTLKRRNNAKACFSYENMLLSTRYPQLYSGPAADESIETSSLSLSPIYCCQCCQFNGTKRRPKFILYIAEKSNHMAQLQCARIGRHCVLLSIWCYLVVTMNGFILIAFNHQCTGSDWD